MVEDIPVAGTPLDPGLFSGKRRAPRKRRALAVECRTASGDVVHARTVDVSRGGMLLELLDEDLRTPADASHLVTFATQMMTLFPEGIDASFGSGAVHAKAAIVRLVSDGAGATTILVGCRFEAPLENVDCRLLGLDFEGDETVARAAAAAAARAEQDAVPAGEDALAFLADLGNPWKGMLAETASGRVAVAEPAVAEAPPAVAAPSAPAITPRAPRSPSLDDAMHRLRRRPATDARVAPFAEMPSWAPVSDVVAHLFPATSSSAASPIEPPMRGRVTEMMTRAVVVELTGPDGEGDVVGLRAALGASARLVCLRDGRVLWETVARVQRLADAHGAVSATLIADRPAPPSVRRTFGPLVLETV